MFWNLSRSIFSETSDLTPPNLPILNSEQTVKISPFLGATLLGKRGRRGDEAMSPS